MRVSGDEQYEISIQVPGLKLGMCGRGVGLFGAKRSTVYGLRCGQALLDKERGRYFRTSVLRTAALETDYETQAWLLFVIQLGNFASHLALYSTNCCLSSISGQHRCR